MSAYGRTVAVAVSVVCATLAGSVHVPNASAVTASNVRCSGCVGTTDIATGGVRNADIYASAVTGSKIAASAVGASDIATAAVGGDEIATNAVGAAEIAADAVTTAEILNGTIAVEDLAFDPATQAELDAAVADPRASYSDTAIVSSGDVGDFGSLAIGLDGLGIVAYFAGSPQNDLQVAHCSDLGCTTATVVVLDSAGDVGRNAALAIGADGLPVISYRDETGPALKVIHCVDRACTGANAPTTVDATNDAGRSTSMVIGVDGLPIVAYEQINVTGDLAVVHCTNASCSTHDAPSVLNDGGNYVADDYTDIAVGADGVPIIAYRDSTTGSAMAVHCADPVCSAFDAPEVVQTGSNFGVDISMAIGPDGKPVLAYKEANGINDLWIAHCTDTTCTAATTSMVDPNNVGSGTSTAFTTDGYAIVSYYSYSATGDMKFAHCSNTTCSAFNTSVVSGSTAFGISSSIAIGVDGLPLIAHYDVGSGDQRVVHCTNNFCLPYVQP